VLVKAAVEVEDEVSGITPEDGLRRSRLTGSDSRPLPDFGNEKVAGDQDGGQDEEQRYGCLPV
jgi:hypothetical protein